LQRCCRTPDLYRKQIDLGLDGDPRAALKARVVLRKLCGPIVIEPGEEEGSPHPHAVIERALDRRNGAKWCAVRRYEPLPPIGLYGDVLTPAVIVSLETGLRRGELFALEWPSVDL
jgi:hypothetical protein